MALYVPDWSKRGSGVSKYRALPAWKRANQISVEIKNDLSKKLAEFASYNDNLEEVFENREQIEISRYYEKLPKPTLIATQEYVEGKIYYRNPAKEKEKLQ